MRKGNAVSFRLPLRGVALCLAVSGITYGTLFASTSGDASARVAGDTVTTYVFASGGILAASSTNFVNNATIGQVAVGLIQSTNYRVNSGFWGWPGRPTGVRPPDASSIPTAFLLEQNYPNPFNPTTVVSWQQPVVSWVRLTVFDLLGREVSVLMDEEKAPGRYEVKWDASQLASGMYICRMTAGTFVASSKMLLAR